MHFCRLGGDPSAGRAFFRPDERLRLEMGSLVKKIHRERPESCFTSRYPERRPPAVSVLNLPVIEAENAFKDNIYQIWMRVKMGEKKK